MLNSAHGILFACTVHDYDDDDEHEIKKENPKMISVRSKSVWPTQSTIVGYLLGLSYAVS